MLAPGERVELLADLSACATGANLELRSLEFSGPGGMMAGQTPPNGAPLSILRAQIGRGVGKTLTIPSTLSSITRLTKLGEPNLDYESKWASLTFEIK